MTTHDYGRLTIRHAQIHQPWTVPYSVGVDNAHQYDQIPHVLGSHIVLHIAKTAGKIATVFENLDHGAEKLPNGSITQVKHITPEQHDTLKDMAADLLVEALRIANLYNFDLATEHVRRVEETNRKVLPPWD